MKTFISLKAKVVLYTFLLSTFSFTALNARTKVSNTDAVSSATKHLSVSSHRTPSDDPAKLNSLDPKKNSANNPQPVIIPSFKLVDPICINDPLAPLATTSLNGITGTWAPAINNQVTTTYIFTPDPGQDAIEIYITIVVDPCCYQPDFCFSMDNRKLSFTTVSPSTHPSPCVYRYKWYWGDGTSSGTFNSAAAAANVKKTYANMGAYNVCLEVKKICPGSSDTCCKMICKTINTIEKCDPSKINAELDYSLKSSAAGTIVAPITAGSGFKALAGSIITIDYGTPSIPPFVGTTGTNTFTLADAAATYTTAGTYEYCVTLKYVNEIGDSCTDKRCKSIIIEPFCQTQAYFKVSSCAKSFTFEFTPFGNDSSAVVDWLFNGYIPASSVGNETLVMPLGNAVMPVCMNVVQGKCSSSICYTLFTNGSTTTLCGAYGPLSISENESPTNIDDIDLKSVILPTEEGKENLSSFVYPNPTRNEVNLVLNAPKATMAKIILRASDGRVVSTKTVPVSEVNSKEIVDFSNLENGMYVISIEVDGQINSHKISVVK
jgi:hypothetical protein